MTLPQKRRKINSIGLAAFLFGMLCCMNIAFASDGQWIITEGGTSVDLTEMKTAFESVWKMMCNIAYPLATVGIIWSATKMMMVGDEKDGARARKQMVYCLLTVAALLILPVVVEVGIDIGLNYGWDPASIAPSPSPVPT